VDDASIATTNATRTQVVLTSATGSAAVVCLFNVMTYQ